MPGYSGDAKKGDTLIHRLFIFTKRGSVGFSPGGVSPQNPSLI